MSNSIYFYGENEDNYFLSNFYPSPFILDGLSWKTTEHYFQAQKFIGCDYFNQIRDAEDPGNAKLIARNPPEGLERRKDWSEVKIGIMKKAMMAKFTQDEELKKKLIETGNAELIEHTNLDEFWGDAGDGSGGNWCGKCLMMVRDEIMQKK